MTAFLMENIANLLVGAAVAGLLAFSLWHIRRERKKAAASGGCGGCCGCCKHAGDCHGK